MNRQALIQKLIADHGAALDECADAYFEGAEGTEGCASKQELAAEILKHFGMLYRYTGDNEFLKQFQEMPKDDRRVLCLDAALLITDSPLPEITFCFSAEELLSETQMEMVKTLFFRRDDLGVVIDMIRLLVYDLIENGDAELEQAVMGALRVENEMDRILRQNPSLAVVAGAPVRALREFIVTDIDPVRQWWLTDRASAMTDATETEIDQWLSSLTVYEATNRESCMERLTEWLAAKKQEFMNLCPKKELHLLAAASDTIIRCSVFSPEIAAEVEFSTEERGIHINARTKNKGIDLLANSRLCYLDDPDSRYIQLDENGYACVRWEEIPDSVCLGLEDKSGNFLGFLEMDHADKE